MRLMDSAIKLPNNSFKDRVLATFAVAVEIFRQQSCVPSKMSSGH